MLVAAVLVVERAQCEKLGCLPGSGASSPPPTCFLTLVLSLCATAAEPLYIPTIRFDRACKCIVSRMRLRRLGVDQRKGSTHSTGEVRDGGNGEGFRVIWPLGCERWGTGGEGL